MRLPFALTGFVAVTLLISAPDLLAHGGGGSGGGGGWSGGGGHGGGGHGNFFVVAFLVQALAFMVTDTHGGGGITPIIPTRIMRTMPITAGRTTVTKALSLTPQERCKQHSHGAATIAAESTV